MRQAWRIVVTTAIPCFLLAGVVAAQEAPPPPVEPRLAPGSRLVDPRADQLVRQMSDRLAKAAAFALEAAEVFDEVPEHSPRVQLTSRLRCRHRGGQGRQDV